MHSFNKGDKVQLINGNLKGVVISSTMYKAIIVDEDGFEDEYLLVDIVKQTFVDDYESSFDKIPLNKEIKKNIKDSKSNISKEIKEIDLHMHELSGSTNGMTNHEIVLYQLNEVKKALKYTDKRFFSKIVFIHGVGAGKLKKEIQGYLKQNKIFYQEASFKKYGRGALEIQL